MNTRYERLMEEGSICIGQMQEVRMRCLLLKARLRNEENAWEIDRQAGELQAELDNYSSAWERIKEELSGNGFAQNVD